MIRKILLAYDGSENARRALDLAAELAAKLEAGLIITHVLMHGRPPDELMRMAEVEHLMAQMQETPSIGVSIASGRTYDLFSSTRDYVGAQRVITAVGDQLVGFAKTRAEALGAMNVTTNIRMGDFAEQIMDAAQEAKADMIVVGSRGLGTLRSAVLGSVSQKVVHHAAQSVVTVK